MLLSRLKYWRELRGYSVRELAARSGINYSSISLLENLKRPLMAEPVRNLAAALAVEVTDLYEAVEVTDLYEAVEVTDLYEAVEQNTNKTQTVVTPARGKNKPAGNFWVMDEDDAFGPLAQPDAERLKVRLGKGRVIYSFFP